MWIKQVNGFKFNIKRNLNLWDTGCLLWWLDSSLLVQILKAKKAMQVSGNSLPHFRRLWYYFWRRFKTWYINTKLHTWLRAFRTEPIYLECKSLFYKRHNIEARNMFHAHVKYQHYCYSLLNKIYIYITNFLV